MVNSVPTVLSAREFEQEYVNDNELLSVKSSAKSGDWNINKTIAFFSC